jgi:hypothetical protein
MAQQFGLGEIWSGLRTMLTGFLSHEKSKGLGDAGDLAHNWKFSSILTSSHPNVGLIAQEILEYKLPSIKNLNCKKDNSNMTTIN